MGLAVATPVVKNQASLAPAGPTDWSRPRRFSEPVHVRFFGPVGTLFQTQSLNQGIGCFFPILRRQHMIVLLLVVVFSVLQIAEKLDGFFRLVDLPVFASPG
jgi:hypothetical protein